MKTNIALYVICLAAASAFGGIKDAYTGRFRLGAALGKWVYEETPNAESDIVAANFSSITAENEMKPERVQPREGVFHWDSADKFVAFGERHGMKIIGHCLVWHYQTPDWFFKNADGSKADRETLIARMRTHIHAVVGRYKGRVHGWDVVNEAFDDAGALHPSPWRDGIGEDFIELAFRFAHEADPDAELYYNDFNMFNQNKIAGVLRMVREFRAKGVRIDGVGMQSHVALNRPNLADYEASIVAFAAEGVKVMITELDVSVLPAAWGLSAEVSRSHDYDEKFNPWKNGVLPDEMQQRLARRYEELFRIYLKHADSIDRVTFWGVADGMSWLNNFPVRGRTDYPLLFDRSLKPKPCAAAVLRLAEAASGDASGQKKSDQSSK
jgi:endo-1,4-beta-xylanase